MYVIRASVFAAASALALSVVGCGGGTKPDPKAREAAEWALRRGGTVRVADVAGVIRDVGRLPGGAIALEEIDLNGVGTAREPVEDRELKVLEGLTNLRSLGLLGANVTDKGCETIATVKSLRELELSQTQVTDQGLETLAALPDIEKVFLRNVGPKLTDDGVKAFERQTGAKVYR
jgi:hypothetical protein